MLSASPFLTIFYLLASFNTVAIGIALIARRNQKNPSLELRFSAILICVGTQLGIFALLHNGWLGYGPLVRIANDTMALLIGALVFDYVRGTLKQKQMPLWGYTPAMGYLVLSVLMGPTFYAPIKVIHIVMINLIYVAAAFGVYGIWLRDQARIEFGQARKKAAEWLLLAAASVLLIQVISLSRGGLQPGENAAPLLGAGFMLALFVVFMFFPKMHEQFVKPILKAQRFPKGPGVEVLTGVMEKDELFLNPALTLQMLADRLDVRSRDVSEVINSETGGSFTTYVNGFRIERAKALLESEAEARSSVEAISMLCGFASRSSFYEAFRRDTRMSPGDYRKKRK